MPAFSVPLSGLDANSAALSAISNNLANLNTVGYKDVSVAFHDLFYQSLGTSGSGNPLQLGVGSGVASMEGKFTAGSVQSDGVPTHAAIKGDGFFVVQRNGVQEYTRAGDFLQDSDGRLITADGGLVMGYPAAAGVVNTNAPLQPITIPTGQSAPPNPTSQMWVKANLDASDAVGATFTSAVDVYDSLGTSHTIQLAFTKTGAGQWNYVASISGADVGLSSNEILSNGTLQFDGEGNLTPSSAGSISISVSGLADGANKLDLTWKLTDSNGQGLITQVASPSTTMSKNQDGFRSGELLDCTIGPDGVVQGNFTDGQSLALAQLALATFANNGGLLRSGNNDFQSTLASGSAVIGTPEIGGRGSIAGGALELSNVDIATEFSSLIVAQRGFQANARAITTFDEITQDTINLKH